MAILYTILSIWIGYLMGSVSWAIIVTKFVKKQDIREHGSNNAGATNVVRSYGKKLGVVVLTLDVLKVIIPVLIGWLIKENVFEAKNMVLQPIVIAVFIGHFFPVFHKFKGGKGAANFIGFTILIDWWQFFIGFVIWLFIYKKTKIVSLSSLLASFMMLLLAVMFSFIFHTLDIEQVWLIPFFSDSAWWVNGLYFAAGWVLLVLKHLPNIKRLRKGEENKFK